MARERLGASRSAAEGGYSTAAASLAYYAMFYAARAALSERDRYAKTHAGTWNLFAESFVDGGHFDRELFAAARRIQTTHERADYDAVAVSAPEAETIVAVAERFVAAVAVMLE